MDEQIQNALQQPEIDGTKQNSPVWGPWQTTGLGIAIFLIYAAAQVVVLFAFAATKFALNPGLGISRIISDLSANGLVVSLSVIASATIGVILIIVFVRARRRASISEYLGLKSITKRTALINLAVIAGLIVLLELIGSAVGRSGDSGFSVDIYQTPGAPVLLWLASVIFAPVFEETFFRGFLFAGWLGSHIGAVATIVLTAVLWAALHMQYDLYGMASIFILGIAFGIVRLKTGSLWSTLLMHSAWNLAAMIGAALYVRGIGR
jgi:membrane protease YdiL (CAAX protease family)